MKKTTYYLKNDFLKRDLCIALIADLHGNPPDQILSILRQSEAPDLIAVPGDIGERLDGNNAEETENFLRFFKEVTQIAPTYFSYGNHELGAAGHAVKHKENLKNCGQKIILPEILSQLKKMGVHLLDDTFEDFGNIRVGGLTSGMIHPDNVPKTDWLPEFCGDNKFRILLSHHPEYYEKYLRALPIDLILSGHAHGGHWRIFGRGIFAPGQGLFPKYTSGVTDNRLVISRGTGDHTWIPRLFNPHEVVYLTVKGNKY